MTVFAHHFGVEILGREFAPETPLEHVMAFGVTGIMLALMIYGAIALVRDFRRWRRPAAQ